MLRDLENISNNLKNYKHNINNNFNKLKFSINKKWIK